MPFTITCPNCSMSLAVSEAHIGQQGKCSRCGTVFTIEMPRVATPVAPPPPIERTPVYGNADIAPGVTRVSEGISRGFTVLHSNLGNFMLIALCFAGMSMVISSFAIIPCVGVFVALGAILVVAPALTAGFYRACLKQADGGQAEVADLFGEFQQWLDYVLLALLKLAIGLVIWIPGAVVIGLSLLPLSRHAGPIVPLLVVGVLIQVACLVTWALSLIFVLPALVDRRRGIGDAVATSWRLMISNPMGTLGAVLMAMLLSLLGTLLCCVGWIYTLPATFCMFASIYRTAMPPLMASQPHSIGTPPPVPPAGAV